MVCSIEVPFKTGLIVLHKFYLQMVEEMMKRLLNSPPSLPQPPPDKMLSNVFWLSKDQRLIDYIKV